MNDHFLMITQTCYFKLYCLATICGFVTNATIVIFVSAFILLRIDYCNLWILGSTFGTTVILHGIESYAA